MFFSITPEPDQRFPNHHWVNFAWFNCDNGWHQAPESIFYKGYADTVSLESVVQQFDLAGSYTGNYAVIQCSTDKIVVRHNRNRNFELWHNDTCVTNLPGCDSVKNIWANYEIHVLSDLTQTLHRIDTDCRANSGMLSWSQALDRVQTILDQDVTNFFAHNKVNMRLYYSGGVDTLLLYSLLTHHAQSFELITYTHYEQDEFTSCNQENLNYFWNYKQIHHWIEPAWLATGSHGDEYLLRGPEVIAQLTSWHDINFAEVMADSADHYHGPYFAKQADLWHRAWQDRHKFQDQLPTLEHLHTYVINFLLNDYQYLHLGNTMTWTPFKNINLARTLLQCDINQLLPQFTNAALSQQLIARTDPELLTSLSRYKNHNATENVLELVKYHKNTQKSIG